ncbi:hypothetical protein K2Y11_14675 [bacterium]|nr:hypothetical protein [bacterium]
MMQLEPTHVARLKEALEQGSPVLEAVPKAIGDTEACNGLWRFYSESWPAGGVRLWNTESQWKQHWEAFLPQGAFAFGEDVFGNQLIVVPGEHDIFLWNHENGVCTDLYSDPVNLLTTASKDGIDWIDLYSDGSLAVARRFGPVARESHLHWTTPLILGGVVNDSNISVVEREMHLVGHAKLWSRVRNLPLGTIVTRK